MGSFLLEHLVLTLCLYLCRTLGADTDDAQEIPLHAQMLTGAPLVEYLQKNQELFEVRTTPTPGFKYKLMDVAFANANQNLNPVVNDDNDTGADLPENYDPRIVWRNCSSFHTIRDQANCGSCWAVSTAAAISDRICVATKGKKQVYISATDILTCCGAPCGMGCQGGWPIRAWEFFEYDGVVSGGPYLGKGCCSPYPLHPCGQHGNDTFYGNCRGMAPTPPCKKRCQPGFRGMYRIDKRYGEPGRAYRLPKSEVKIRREIKERGSVTATFAVYEDFSHYKSGIYKHTAGYITGFHAVKMIGWGKDINGTDYWLIANSWHDDWGENGFFRMIRGINDCGIEETVAAGIVDVESL
ncbi:unnamed protein product [Haemonchus placei]|uniref:Pept_C1 domain-containing protein n=1 Tax=Haemonchus placei TaxID=6290 RepID=A0A0N4WEG5_HAEPC|nr:unnamed protein product [Haemonchus placei]